MGKTRLTRSDWTRFLEVLARCGSVLGACRAAGIGRSHAYRRRDANPAFAAAWCEALEEATDVLELEAMAGRSLPGISAWARRTQIILWDPQWWPLPPSVQHEPEVASTLRRTQATQLLKHELTHSLMFQRVGRLPADPQDRIPFWFREGMATLTAGEGAQWPPPESLSQWLAKHPKVELLRDARTLSRTDPLIAYMLAHLWWPDFPVPVGIVRNITRPTHDQMLNDQIATATAARGQGDLKRLLNSGETWTVE